MGSPIINVPKATVRAATRRAIVDRLAPYERVVEVGIGRRTGVADALAGRAGVSVTATDIVERPVPAGVTFRRDDVTAPDPAVYADAGAIYALNLPPELHRSTAALAREHGAACVFTTLGAEPPAVAADPETVPGETLFWVRR